MDIEQVGLEERRALGAWAAASATAGAGLWLLGRWAGQPVLGAFGAQSLQWGAVNGAQVVLDGVTSPATPSEVRFLHTVGVVVDLAAIAGGAVVAARPEALPRWLLWPYRPGLHLRGHALALLVQGVVLLTIEGAALRRLPAPGATGLAED